MPKRLFSGRVLMRAVCGLAAAAALASAQTPPPQKAVSKKAAVHRANELTLAGLRPGQDSTTRAAKLNKPFGDAKNLPGDQAVWFDPCRDLSLTIDGSKGKQIEEIRLGVYATSTVDCTVKEPSPWKTGLGLRVGDGTAKLAQLYGEPDSKSPSTRGGQPLELWYYAFDWAGADVPQVMEVLCTRETEGKPGRVVEITLAAPSL
jgi:hypothetical protein